MGGSSKKHEDPPQAHSGWRETYEELTTILAQVEACLNSQPLVPLSSADKDGVEVLTPGHFLIGQPLSALPDPSLLLSLCIFVASLAIVSKL